MVGYSLLLSYNFTYVFMDEPTALEAAKLDPVGFLSQLGVSVIIDEIQRAPELLLPMKLLVDRNRVPGRFILTGSANVLNLPKVADSLAGRMEVQTLWPLSQGELNNHKEGFIDLLFSQRTMTQVSACSYSALVSKWVVGGFPEVVLRKNEKRQRQWFKSYLNALIQRDIRDLANIDGLSSLPSLLSTSNTGG